MARRHGQTAGHPVQRGRQVETFLTLLLHAEVQGFMFNFSGPLMPHRILCSLSSSSQVVGRLPPETQRQVKPLQGTGRRLISPLHLILFLPPLQSSHLLFLHRYELLAWSWQWVGGTYRAENTSAKRTLFTLQEIFLPLSNTTPSM